MKLLDLFCGAGGCSVGYHQAGFEVVGVDINPQPRYPFEFIQTDALEYLSNYGQKYDVLHASPPCQVYSVLRHLARKDHVDLISDTRSKLKEFGKPYIIENVPGAPLIDPLLLCGSMFGLGVFGAQLRRHRLFEMNVGIYFTPPCQHISRTIGVFGSKARDTAAEKRHYSKPKATRGSPDPAISFTLDEARVAMDIDWMTFAELSQAIPPAYSKFIGDRIKEFIVF